MPKPCPKIASAEKLLSHIVSAAGRSYERRIELSPADLRVDPDGIHLRLLRRIRQDGDRQPESLCGLSGAAVADVRRDVEDHAGTGAPAWLRWRLLRRLLDYLCGCLRDKPRSGATRRQCQHRGPGCRLQQCWLYGDSDVPFGVRAGKRTGLDHRDTVHGLRPLPVRRRRSRNRPPEGSELLVDRRQGCFLASPQSSVDCAGRGPLYRLLRAERGGTRRGVPPPTPGGG